MHGLSREGDMNGDYALDANNEDSQSMLIM